MASARDPEFGTVSPVVADAIGTAVMCAMVAGRRSLTADAELVFSCWTEIVPNDAVGYIGLALTLARRGDLDASVKILQACQKHVSRPGLVEEVLEDVKHFTAAESPARAPGPATLRKTGD